MKVIVALAILAFISCEAWQPYQDKIPNGYNVRVNGVKWNGVGHTASSGGGARNVFGLAFKAAGYTWTTALCNADSDGDGFSNGVELGDPNCEWTPGNTPSRVRGITHPGINTSVPAFGRSSTCPTGPRSVPFFGNSSVTCTKANACLRNFCDCLGLETATGFKCGAVKSGSTIVRNCSIAARCISRRMKCMNAAADDATSGCTNLKDLKMANLAVAGGQGLYNQSNAFKSCKSEACKMLNSTAGNNCPLDYGQLCRSPVRFIGTMLLRGKWAALLSNAAKKAKLQLAIESDLTRKLRFDCLVRKMQSRSNRRRAGETKLAVEFEADGVSGNNAELSSGVTSISGDTAGSFLTDTLAEYTAENGAGSTFSVAGVSAGSSSSAVFSSSASTTGSVSISGTSTSSSTSSSTTGTTSSSTSTTTGSQSSGTSTSSSTTGSSGSTSGAATQSFLAAALVAVIGALVF